MANFTPADVKQLREKTGVGMMDCKQALTDADGNMDKAVELLREKGLAAANKKASRIAAEGMVVSIAEDGVGAVVEVNSETDFVAKNGEFQQFVKDVAGVVIKNDPASVEDLMNLDIGGMTVDAALKEKILKIGENIKIRRFMRIAGEVSTYVHGGGTIGVMVEFDTDLASNPAFAVYAKDIALQVAASAPQYLNKEDVPVDVIEKEKQILMAQTINEGKPEAVAEKIVAGRINKYYTEICLNEQPFVKDDKVSVSKYTKDTAVSLGGKIGIKQFVRFEKGEGLEKREDNFADEVANMIK